MEAKVTAVKKLYKPASMVHLPTFVAPGFNGPGVRKLSTMHISSGSRPVLKFGVVADVQYADKDDLVKEKPREDGSKRVMFYRSSLDKLRRAVEDFNRRDVEFVVQLGDLIDGNVSQDLSEKDLGTALAATEELDVNLYHVIGNHCRSVSLPHLLAELRLEKGFYSEVVAKGWRLIVLNAADIFRGAVDANHSDRSALKAMCDEYNTVDVPWAGGISDEQMQWFDNQLRICAQQRQRAIICSHYPTWDEAARDTHTIVNAPAVLEILDRYPGVVVAWFSGHDHLGGYSIRKGVHHVTFEAVVESRADTAHGFVGIFEDGSISIEGLGAVSSRELRVEETTGVPPVSGETS